MRQAALWLLPQTKQAHNGRPVVGLMALGLRFSLSLFADCDLINAVTSAGKTNALSMRR